MRMFELFFQTNDIAVDLTHALDVGEKFSANFAFRAIFTSVVRFVIAQDILHFELSAIDAVGNADDFAHAKGALQQDVEDILLAIFDAFGDFDFSIARQERDIPRLRQIAANWIGVFIAIFRGIVVGFGRRGGASFGFSLIAHLFIALFESIGIAIDVFAIGIVEQTIVVVACCFDFIFERRIANFDTGIRHIVDIEIISSQIVIVDIGRIDIGWVDVVGIEIR